jgi:Reverse transcriptase (RNA-dependent DNA polymerase)
LDQVKRSTMPRGRRCVHCKWVFDIKRNGVFCARLVECGYYQIPGVDFTEAYSPVINDVTFLHITPHPVDIWFMCLAP